MKKWGQKFKIDVLYNYRIILELFASISSIW